MWHEILAGVYLRGLAIFFSFAGTNFCDFKGDWFLLLGINFCDFQKVQYKSLIIFRFYQERVKNTYFLYYGVYTLCKTSKTDCFSLSFILIVLLLNKIQVVVV